MAKKVLKRYLLLADYMADPSVHVFDGKIHIYPSHDWESAAPDDDFGSEYDMKDYHVLTIEGDDPMTSPVWTTVSRWTSRMFRGRAASFGTTRW